MRLDTTGGNADPQGIVQEIEIWLYEQMVYAQPSICPGEYDAQIPMGFWDKNGSSNPRQTTRPNQQKSKQKKAKNKTEHLPNCGLYSPGWRRSIIEIKQKVKGIEKTVEHESACDTNCNCFSCDSHQRISINTGGLRNRRTTGDHPNCIIIEIGQKTKKSLRDLRRLAVTQTPVKKPSANGGLKKKS